MSWAKSWRTAAAIFLPAQPRLRAGPRATEKKTSVVLQSAAEGTRGAIELRLCGPERQDREPELAPPSGLSDTKLPPRPLERPGSHAPTWDWLEDLKACTWYNLSKGSARQNYSVFHSTDGNLPNKNSATIPGNSFLKESSHPEREVVQWPSLRVPGRSHVGPESASLAVRDDAPRVARGRGSARKGRAEAAGGGGAAQGRAGRGGAPGVLWDAAVEWRWARDFEQTRVCVSEAPPPPRLLGAPGARREEEAAAPPARVSVSSGEPGRAAGTGAGPAGR
ncbi:hypothetical protein LEMLEM_LOCUS24808 [Lemmus lemmus]